MSTGSRLLDESMPHNHKQGSVYPTHYDYGLEKTYSNWRARKACHVRKMGQTKVRKQLKVFYNILISSPDCIDRPSLYGASPSNMLDNKLYYSPYR